MDSEGFVGLPDDHGWDGNRGGLSALTPLLIYKVQVAMHPGHLVRSEAVSAVVICGDRKTGTRETWRFQPAKSTKSGINSALFTPNTTLALVRLHKHVPNK